MSKTRVESPVRELGDVVSIIGPGMKVVGDCSSDGTIRVEGQVEGAVRAAKSVVVGKDGVVIGDISTQDAIIAGRVNGSLAAESRVELQATCHIEGDIRSRRVKLDEGGQVDGRLHMGGGGRKKAATAASASGVRTDPGAGPEPGAAAGSGATEARERTGAR
ncbi:MAG: polymer-forming cytoskeletal protein [Gemmatimonadota bacterium]